MGWLGRRVAWPIFRARSWWVWALARWLSAIIALGSFSTDYAIRAYLTGGLPAGQLMTWLNNWLAGLLLLPFGLLLMLFPTGRLPSPRWQPVAWVLAVSAAYQVAKFMFEPVLSLQVSRSERIEIANPVLPVEFFSAVILPYSVAVLSGWAALVAAALVPLVRYRRAGQVEGQQLKWLVFVLAPAVVGGLAAAALIRILPDIANALGCSCWSRWHSAFPWPSAPPCCATGCTTSTGSSTAP